MTDVTKVKVSNNSQRFLVSLDAHKRTYFVKIVDSRTDKVLFNSGIVGTIKNVIDRLEMLKLAKKKLQYSMKQDALVFIPTGNCMMLGMGV